MSCFDRVTEELQIAMQLSTDVEKAFSMGQTVERAWNYYKQNKITQTQYYVIAEKASKNMGELIVKE